MQKLLRNSVFIIFLFLIGCKEPKQEHHFDSQNIPVKIIDNPVEGNSSLPRLFSNGSEIYMSWVTETDSMDMLRYALLKDNKWGVVNNVASGSNWFTNWADFPVISENEGKMLHTYLPKSSEDTYAYDIEVVFTRPINDSTTAQHYPIFEESNFKIHNDTTKTEHGFVSAVPIAEGGFFVTWLDGRNTAGASHDDHNAHAGAMTLRSAVIDSEGQVDQRIQLDDRVCDCCQTAATSTSNGAILVAYRDRSEDEIRDISVMRRSIEGKWSKAQTVGNDNWKLAGCPVNGPSIHAFENSIALAWFTASKGEGEVQLIFSKDGGKSFGKPIRVDSGNATGRVDVVMLNSKDAAVLWMEPEGDDEVIRLMKISSEGLKGKAITISKTSAERSSGFPQLERLGDQLIIAHTIAENDLRTIRTVSVKLNDL